MIYRHIFAALALLLFGTPSMAARPLVTDDAEIVAAKACQLESWMQFRTSGTEYWAIPACNPTGNWELSLGGMVDHPNGGSFDVNTVQMQAKTRLKRPETNDYGVAFTMGTMHEPQEEKKLFSQFYVNMPVTFSMADDRFLLHLNLGANHHRAQHKTRATWGVGTETRLMPNLILVAETFGEDRGQSLFQAGFRFWVVPGKVQIDTTYGNTFSGDSSQRFASIGLRILSAPFLP